MDLAATMPRFGEQRIHSGNLARRILFRLTGVLDPAHYLHHRYLRTALDRQRGAPPRTILDAGCGAGDHAIYLARRFPGARVLGVDANQVGISRNTAIVEQMGVRNLAFAAGDLATLDVDGEFDLTVCIDVLEHIRAQEEALTALIRATAPGGMVFVHMPLVRPVPVPLSRHLQEFHEWAREEHVATPRSFNEFRDMVAGAGLTVESAIPTFGRWTGELATSLFAIPYRNTPINRVAQLLLGLPCRIFAASDHLMLDSTRYAICIWGRKPK